MMTTANANRAAVAVLRTLPRTARRCSSISSCRVFPLRCCSAVLRYSDLDRDQRESARITPGGAIMIPHNGHRRYTATGATTDPAKTNNDDDDKDTGAVLYLHVGPSGDCWTGRSIFAAKHLQPDYVRSVKLPTDIDVDILLELIEEDGTGELAGSIYDNERIPEQLLQDATAAVKARTTTTNTATTK